MEHSIDMLSFESLSHLRFIPLDYVIHVVEPILPFAHGAWTYEYIAKYHSYQRIIKESSADLFTIGESLHQCHLYVCNHCTYVYPTRKAFVGTLIISQLWKPQKTLLYTIDKSPIYPFCTTWSRLSGGFVPTSYMCATLQPYVSIYTTIPLAVGGNETNLYLSFELIFSINPCIFTAVTLCVAKWIYSARFTHAPSTYYISDFLFLFIAFGSMLVTVMSTTWGDGPSLASSPTTPSVSSFLPLVVAGVIGCYLVLFLLRGDGKETNATPTEDQIQDQVMLKAKKKQEKGTVSESNNRSLDQAQQSAQDISIPMVAPSSDTRRIGLRCASSISKSSSFGDDLHGRIQQSSEKHVCSALTLAPSPSTCSPIHGKASSALPKIPPPSTPSFDTNIKITVLSGQEDDENGMESTSTSVSIAQVDSVVDSSMVGPPTKIRKEGKGQGKKKLLFVDNIKIFLIVMVLAYHAAQFMIGWVRIDWILFQYVFFFSFLFDCDSISLLDETHHNVFFLCVHDLSRKLLGWFNNTVCSCWTPRGRWVAERNSIHISGNQSELLHGAVLFLQWLFCTVVLRSKRCNYVFVWAIYPIGCSVHRVQRASRCLFRYRIE